MGLPSLGAWGSAPDPWVRSSRALLSKSYRSNPQGSCSGQGLSTPRPCPPGAMVGWEPCVDPGGQRGRFGGRGAGALLACAPSPGSPLPAPALGSSGAQAMTWGRAAGGPPRPSALVAAQSSRLLQAQLGGLGPRGPPWVPTLGERPGLEEEVLTDAETTRVLFVSQAPWRDTHLRVPGTPVPEMDSHVQPGLGTCTPEHRAGSPCASLQARAAGPAPKVKSQDGRQHRGSEPLGREEDPGGPPSWTRPWTGPGSTLWSLAGLWRTAARP